MEPGLSDTDPEAERVHLELIRAASPERRLRLAFSLSRTVLGLARAKVERELPEASPQERDLRFLALLYGDALADEVRLHLAERKG